MAAICLMSTQVVAGVVYGTVVDSITGEPIIGARIELNDKTGAITDTEGKYTILNVPAGDYYLLADADYYFPLHSTWVKVPEDGRIKKDIKLSLDLVLSYPVVVIDTIWRSGKQIAFVVMESDFYRDRFHIHSSGILPADTMFLSVDVIQLPDRFPVKPREVAQVSIGSKLCFETEYLGRAVYDFSVTRFVQPIAEFLQLQQMIRDSLIKK